MRKAEDIARQFCTPLPGNGPLAAVFDNVVVTARVAQKEALEAVMVALTKMPSKRDPDTVKAAITIVDGFLASIEEDDQGE